MFAYIYIYIYIYVYECMYAQWVDVDCKAALSRLLFRHAGNTLIKALKDSEPDISWRRTSYLIPLGLSTCYSRT